MRIQQLLSASTYPLVPMSVILLTKPPYTPIGETMKPYCIYDSEGTYLGRSWGTSAHDALIRADLNPCYYVALLPGYNRAEFAGGH